VYPSYTKGKSGLIDFSIVDASGKEVKGRQIISVKITNPDGAVNDASGLFRAVNGKASITFRPALNDKPGPWCIEVREQTSGLKDTGTFQLQ